MMELTGMHIAYICCVVLCAIGYAILFNQTSRYTLLDIIGAMVLSLMPGINFFVVFILGMMWWKNGS